MGYVLQSIYPVPKVPRARQNFLCFSWVIAVHLRGIRILILDLGQNSYFTVEIKPGVLKRPHRNHLILPQPVLPVSPIKSPSPLSAGRSTPSDLSFRVPMFPGSLSPAADFFQALDLVPEPLRALEKARMLQWLSVSSQSAHSAGVPAAEVRTPEPDWTQSSGFLPTQPSPGSASAPGPVASNDTLLQVNEQPALSQSSIDSVHHRLKALEAAVAHPPAKRRKRRTKVQLGAEQSLIPVVPSLSGINPAKLERHQLDETEIELKRYLQTQVRSQLYAAMKYKVGDQMPCHGDGVKPDDANLLWPDFRQNINGPLNRLLQMRATLMVLEDSKVRDAARHQHITSLTSNRTTRTMFQ
ncbi:hypothetical protein CALCODRAFT_221525 [Calocera cornea HHB12733]|uniref:Uncharacterized protein n=1 Tax=Calocera cornea HHB12733 TaxID=1353952 RepID=A0A165C178_9BASI|nr:hypothetical protein CALCODRAFT_221525 [Calocera cornea HHB12733]